MSINRTNCKTRREVFDFEKHLDELLAIDIAHGGICLQESSHRCQVALGEVLAVKVTK